MRRGPVKTMVIRVRERTRCGSELQQEEWAARACFASARLLALFLLSFPSTVVSSHFELSVFTHCFRFTLFIVAT